MKEKLVYDSGQCDHVDATLKKTSLLYFQDALLNEQYENAAELLASARNLGASEDEIQVTIAEVILKLNGTMKSKGAERYHNRYNNIKEDD